MDAMKKFLYLLRSKQGNTEIYPLQRGTLCDFKSFSRTLQSHYQQELTSKDFKISELKQDNIRQFHHIKALTRNLSLLKTFLIKSEVKRAHSNIQNKKLLEEKELIQKQIDKVHKQNRNLKVDVKKMAGEMQEQSSVIIDASKNISRLEECLRMEKLKTQQAIDTSNQRAEELKNVRDSLGSSQELSDAQQHQWQIDSCFF